MRYVGGWVRTTILTLPPFHARNYEMYVLLRTTPTKCRQMDLNHHFPYEPTFLQALLLRDSMGVLNLDDDDQKLLQTPAVYRTAE